MFVGFSMLGIYLLIFAVAILGQLALAFCVYYDAKLNGTREAVLWAVLSGFFNVAALVYLVLRSSNQKKPVACPGCGMWLLPDYCTCPRCGQPRLDKGQPVTPALQETWRRRRKGLLIAWIVGMILPVVLVIVWVVVLIFAMMPRVNPDIVEMGTMFLR